MKQSGFTLIELMMVLAVVALLMLVALPNYQDSVHKARRADGKAALTGLQLAQEKFRANCRVYAGDFVDNPTDPSTCGANASSSKIKHPRTSNEGHYTIAMDPNSVDGNSFTIIATPTSGGAQEKDTDCPFLQIELPAKTKTPADCWY